MKQAKIQPFCRKYSLNLGVYSHEQRTTLARSVTERKVCLFIQNNHFCVLRITAQSSFPDAMDELQKNSKYESNEITDKIPRQKVDNKLHIIYEKNCMFAVFAFDRETCNKENQPYCEAYATSVSTEI